MKKYLKINKQAFWEGAQEIGRVAFFAALSAVIAFALKQLAGMDQSDMVILFGTLALKGLDKYIHEDPRIKSNGLTDTKNLNFLK